MATSLFNGLAFAGVIITIVLQYKELGLQRDELRLTREELKRTADAQQEAQRALAQQARMSFLTTYLQALSATETDSPGDEEGRLLLEVRSRIRTLRTTRAVRSLLGSLEPHLVEIGLEMHRNTLLEGIEQVLRLSERFHDISTITFGLTTSAHQEQKAAVAERVFRSLGELDQAFQIVLQTADIPPGAHARVSAQLMRFREWRDFVDAAVAENGRYGGSNWCNCRSR